MEANTGICLQIGLNKTSEYLYLVDPTYNDFEGDAPREIPPHISFKSWKYYGVDCDPCSICRMLETHQFNENAEWIVAAINEGVDPYLFRYGSWFVGEVNKHPSFYVPSISLDRLIDSLGFGKLDVLAIDIEGLEFPVFRSYSWRIKPEFIAVESHDEHHEELLSIMASQGYTNTLNMETNFYDGEYHTRELQFAL